MACIFHNVSHRTVIAKPFGYLENGFFEVLLMADCAEKEAKVSYALMDRVTELLICSRCFRRSVRKSVRTLISTRRPPMPVCDECSGRIKPGHTAKVIKIG